MLGIGLGVTQRAGRQGVVSRATLAQQILAICGSVNVAMLWIPNPADTTTSTTSDTNARTVTWDADISGRFSAQGHLHFQSNTTGQGGSMPDTQSLSFGNGTVDAAVSFVSLDSHTDTAAARRLITKYDNGGTQREYHFGVNAADQVMLGLFQETGDIAINKISDAAIPMGTPVLLHATYSGLGGATAANGITLGVNASMVAGTATNNASYVAMENTTGPGNIGWLDAGVGQNADGLMGPKLIVAGVLTTAQLLNLKAVFNGAYGLGL